MVSSKENLNNIRQKDEENQKKSVQVADQFNELPIQLDATQFDLINQNDVLSSPPSIPQIASKPILEQQEVRY
jgi:hypothetical protein